MQSIRPIGFFLLMSLLFFCACKKDDTPVDDGESEENLFLSYNALESASEEMIRIGDSLNISPLQAMELTLPYVEQLEGVVEVSFLDSTYLRIETTGGYRSTIRLDERGDDGLSLYRGGASSVSRLKNFDGECSNSIENKKVLLFAAFHDDFYSGNEYQKRVENVIKNGDVDVEVTVLKNEACTPKVLENIDQYGLVILDTHGEPDGVLTGLKFTLIKAEIPGSIMAFEDMLRVKMGSDYYNSFSKKQLSLGKTYIYKRLFENQQIWDRFKQRLDTEYNVQITSKGVRELVPDLSNTIVFANCCYSGHQASTYIPRAQGLSPRNYDPIQPAWMSRNPRTYYGYEAAKSKISYKALNNFCKLNEDTLIQSFFYDGDSTGNAHLLKGTNTSESPWSTSLSFFDEGPLQLNQYAQESWCYGACGDPIIDARDNQEYKTVCIGDQVWMAENLNYNAAGLCYDNNVGNCNTDGRLYSITELTGLKVSNDSTTVQGLCPEGWHVPSMAEYQELIDFCGGESQAADKLRSSTAWPDFHSDEFGFNLLPTGHYTIGGGNSIFRYKDEDTKLWTSSPSAGGLYTALSAFHPEFAFGSYTASGQEWYFSCRCIKD